MTSPQRSCPAELNEERPDPTWLRTEDNEMLVNESELSYDLMKGPQSDLNPNENLGCGNGERKGRVRGSGNRVLYLHPCLLEREASKQHSCVELVQLQINNKAVASNFLSLL